MSRLVAMPFAASLVFVLTMAGPSSSDASAATPSGSVVLASALGSSSNCVKGTASGVTATTVQVAVTAVDISGGSYSNATVGVPSVQEQEQYWNAVAKNINRNGGAGCRKIQLKFYDVNPIDSAGAEQSCLAIAASKPFIVLDVGALVDVNASNCIPEAKIPLVSQYLTPNELTKYSPYYYQLFDVPNDGLRNGILALKQLGYFNATKGFKKLGVLYATCNPSLMVTETAALKQAKIPSSKLVKFNIGCPEGQTYTPASLEQAVLTFKNDGVTDITGAGTGGAVAAFSQEAATQFYKPTFVLANDQINVPGQTGIEAGSPLDLNGAINIEANAYGEASTPGFTPSGGTKKCNAIFAGSGLPTAYASQDGYAGVACSYLWLVQALLNHATSLQAKDLPTALHAVGSVLYPYPFGPVDYSAAPKGSFHGVSYWRPEYYHSSCKCWQVPSATWHAPFA
jgi:hypothetical protein